ncbi:MAG: MraY family glycosyltransferase [Bacteroidales bacterium]|nr:MraY family glycosyltransferase [Bacteroidales bacterium]
MENVLLILALFISCGLVLVTTPPIVRVAKAKKLFDETNPRKLHTFSVPNLGGISLFIAIIITTSVLTTRFSAPGFQLVFAAMVMLFFVGVKDDLIFISPQTKFIIQLLTAILLVALGGFSISNFEGLLFLGKVPPILGQSFTVIFIVLMINAYNLIDGIDGLAGALGVMATLFFGIWFFMNGFIAHAILSASIVGSLLGFLRFNLFSKKYKIFMGDTGSLLLGLLMAMQVIWFLTYNRITGIQHQTAHAPVIALGIIALPLLDTLRVFTLRIMHGKPPFLPDNSHIHHRVLSFLPHHLHSSIGITIGNLFIIASAFGVSYTGLNINIQFLFILLLGVTTCIFPGLMARLMRKKNGIVTPLFQQQNGFNLNKDIRNITYKEESIDWPREKETAEVEEKQGR